MTFIKSRLYKPVKITLPNSTLSVEVGRLSFNTYEDICKWTHLKKAYLESAEAFLNKYIETVKISGEIDLNAVGFEDLKVLLQTCLMQEGKKTQITDMSDKPAAISLFRDEISGVPYEVYLNKIAILKAKLLKAYDGHLQNIRNLIKKNLTAKRKISAIGKHEEYRKARRFRIEQNITELHIKEKMISNSIKNIELEILDILKQEAYGRENYLHRLHRWLTWEIEQLSPQYLDFPLRWCGFLPLDEFNRLYLEWCKKGSEFMEQQLIDFFYDKDNQDFIITQLSDSTINKKRKDIIFEAIHCFYERKYSITIYLLLPQIEGLLWELAELLNSQGKAIFPMSGSNNSAFNSPFYSCDKLHSYHMNNGSLKLFFDVDRSDIPNLVLNSNKTGRVNKFKKIKTLIEESAFRFYLDIDLIEHFCGELYVERNEILHGQTLDFGTSDNATKKLLILLMILHYFEVYGQANKSH